MTVHERPCVRLIVGGGHHDMDTVRRALLDLLAEDPLTLTTCSDGFGDANTFSDVDFLLTYTNNVIPEGDALAALTTFVAQGGRWLAIHGSAALTRFKPPAFELNGILLPGLTDTPDLAPDYMDLLGVRFVSHLAQQPFTVSAGPAAHPVVAGLKPFEIVDEPYILELRGSTDVLLEARYTGEAPGYVEGPWLEDLSRPQLLHHRHGAGETMYLAPGHRCGPYDLRPFVELLPDQPGPWVSDTYLELLRRLIRWGITR